MSRNDRWAALSTPCQIVFDGNLQNSTPTSVGLLLPPDYGR